MWPFDRISWWGRSWPAIILRRLADSDEEVGEEQEEVESNWYVASGRVEVAGDGCPTASRGGGGGLVALSGGGRVREVQGGMVE